jgi:hypothetical protein
MAGTGFRGGFFGCLGVFAAIIFLIFVVLLIGRCSQATTNTATSTPTAPASSTNEATGAPAGPGWSYSNVKDEIQGKSKVEACVTSTNEVHLSFPYHDTTGDLCIRDWPGHGLDSYIHLAGDGQILCGIESCSVRFRFDDGSVRSFPAVGAADNSTNIIFVRRTPALIEALKRSSKATVELTYYQEGIQTFTFKTAGLKWPPPAS